MNFYDRFIELCNENNLKPSPMLESIGIQKTAATNWKKRKSKPTYANLKKIADYFGVSVEYLKGETENPSAESGKGAETVTFTSNNVLPFNFKNKNVNNVINEERLRELYEITAGLDEQDINVLRAFAAGLKANRKND